VTTFVKIFVPPGFEDTTPVDYLEVIRIMFDSKATQGIPWEVVKAYIHHTKHTHIIIASIPTAIFLQIKAQGKETSKDSGVWKTEGFLAPLKLTLANPNDLKNPKTTYTKQTNPQKTTPNMSSQTTSPKTIQTSPQIPPPILSPSTSSTSSSPPVPMSSAKDPFDPLLFPSALSPAKMDVMQETDVEDVNDVVEEIGDDDDDGNEEGEQEMDLGLLQPDPEDKEDFCGNFGENWADKL